MFDEVGATKAWSSAYRTVVLGSEKVMYALFSLVTDEDVVELGPGRWGGLAREVISAGARSYVGVDVLSVPHSIAPPNRFERTDAFSYLNAARDRTVSVSTGFLDKRMLAPRDTNYLEGLAAALADTAPRGLHWIAPDDDGVVHDALVRAGLTLAQVAPDVYETRKA